MGDISGVVEDGRLGIRKEQVKLAKFQGEKEICREEKKVLTALGFVGGVIAGQMPIKTGRKSRTELNYRYGCFKSARYG